MDFFSKKQKIEDNSLIGKESIIKELSPEEEAAIEEKEKTEDTFEAIAEGAAIKEKQEGAGPAAPAVKALAVQAGLILEKSETLKQIETILTEDMGELYSSLPEAVKSEFIRRGEETAGKIEKLISKTKIIADKIVSLIINWLKIIPGINRIFLEQESKIKTDKILGLVERQRKSKISI
ncbi:MAG: hypothetical protein AAB465_02710 [Patescibacteria group bacterium]